MELRASLVASPNTEQLVIRALKEVDVDREGTFPNEVLQTKVGTPGTGKGAYFLCRRKGHGWMKCFQLRDILKRNGIRDNHPRPNPKTPAKKEAKPAAPTAAGNA